MNKTILVVALAIAPLLLTDLAEAKPNKDNTQTSDIKPVKKKVRKKQPVKVEPDKNAFLKTCGILDFTCSTNFNLVTYTSSSEESTSEYWRKEAGIRAAQTTKPTQTPTKVAKKEKDCSWFSCEKGAYQEAKLWEGKQAQANRQELKALFVEGQVPPVDPVRIPWCAAFANAILNRQGYEGTKSLMARSFLHWGSKTNDPKVGDIVITKRGRGNTTGHVGFFEGYEEVDGIKYVKVFGGNTAKMVSTGWFPVTAVLGYRRGAA